MESESTELDRDGRSFEDVAVRVIQQLASPQISRTRDCIEVIQETEPGVVVLITPESIEFRLPSVEWSGGSHGAVPISRFWKRVSHGRLSEKRLMDLLCQAREQRQAEIRPCHFCQRPTPIEHAHDMDGKHVCHGCSEQHQGVVH